MPETVCRMFATRAIADAAAEELRVNGFANVHVFGGAASSDADGYTDQLCQAYVLKSTARVLARGLAAGRGLVVVHAQFGRAGFAMTLLGRHGPVDDGLPDQRSAGPRYDDATPLSSTLQLPVLTSIAHPVETFSSFPSLLGGRWTLSDAINWGVRTERRAPLSESLGMPTLTSAGWHPTAVFGPLVVGGRSQA